MGLKTSIAACAALAAVSFAPAASATDYFANGSFESGFDNWVSNEDLVQLPGVFQHRDQFSVADQQYDTQQGFYLAAMQAGDTAGEAVLLSQTFETAGGFFSGSAAFLGEDFLGFNDRGFVRIFSDTTDVQLFFSDISQVGAFGYTPWTKFTALLAAGTYTVEAGVTNVGDGFNPSFLLVDDFRMTGVAEPATWALMLAGFFGLGSALRRRRAQAA